jgi:beta-1,4-N-acetylglucosaminyltransferase
MMALMALSSTLPGSGPVLLVCSCGGHLLQLLTLRAAWEPFDRVWVTFDKADARSLLSDETVVYAHGPTNRNLKNFFLNLRLATRVIRRHRPAAIVTTGAGVAVPFAWIGRAYGARLVYVESITRINELSLSGRLIAPMTHRLFVQWPELASAVRRARYAGNVLGDG